MRFGDGSWVPIFHFTLLTKEKYELVAVSNIFHLSNHEVFGIPLVTPGFSCFTKNIGIQNLF